MLYDNYRQALDIIATVTIDLAGAMEFHELTIDKIKQYIQDEEATFHTLGREPEADLRKINYVQLLVDLQTVE